MVNILNIETATKNCSVSISANGVLLTYKEISEEQFNHAEKLHVFIKDVISEAGLLLNDIDAIAVSKGPGSYTGLRIGVSAAKGLCYALDIPLISIDTLAVLAQAIKIESGVIVPMIDARRMEVFTQTFNHNQQSIKDAIALIIDDSSFNDVLDDIHLVGDGALKCKEVLKSSKFIYHDNIIYPSAKQMCKLSFDKYNNKQFEDVAYFEPFYLKDFMLTTKKA
jgi:tRNA threonylcarbamoyladenosine biosynthesis protein TsaB